MTLQFATLGGWESGDVNERMERSCGGIYIYSLDSLLFLFVCNDIAAAERESFIT